MISNFNSKFKMLRKNGRNNDNGVGSNLFYIILMIQKQQKKTAAGIV